MRDVELTNALEEFRCFLKNSGLTWHHVEAVHLMWMGHGEIDGVRFVSFSDSLAVIMDWLETKDYDPSFGRQYLDGTIWFSDGTWAEREEYDGSEWWMLRKRPEMPSFLERTHLV
ncbi:MAG: hypothetical protein QF569_23555 [Candidatus Poribacteria bacterium]|jgi:hypothetical protein|nr:hypothetical protein [Candidatus Poribacteria bacterium]